MSLGLLLGVDGDWIDRATCRRLPPEWWESGDDGNRLAMSLCRGACPVRGECADSEPRSVGVIRAGVAYSDVGTVLRLCPCGRPIIARDGRALPGTTLRCPDCGAADRPGPASRLVRRRRGRPPRVATCPRAVAA